MVVDRLAVREIVLLYQILGIAVTCFLPLPVSDSRTPGTLTFRHNSEIPIPEL